MNNDSSLGRGGESPLDRAIDRAVREMMHVDPPPGLRRRVLFRLEPSVTRRPLFLPRHVFAAVAVALALLLGAAMFMRNQGGSPVGNETAPSIASGTPPRVQPGPAPEPQPARDPKDTARGSSTPITRERIQMPRVTNVFGTGTSRVSATADPGSDAVWTGDAGRPKDDASNPVAPLVIAPLMPAAIETPAIEIPPLVIPGPPKGGV